MADISRNLQVVKREVLSIVRFVKAWKRFDGKQGIEKMVIRELYVKNFGKLSEKHFILGMEYRSSAEKMSLERRRFMRL